MQSPYSVFKSNASVPTAQVTLAAAGTRQQLSTVSVPCAKVFLAAGQNNGGILTVGDSSVVAASSGHSGADMQPSGGFTIEIDDLSKIWYDGTNTGDTVSFSFLA
jgi:hypothetical protein